MIDFSYHRAADIADASARGAVPGAAFLAGGTTLVDLARLDVMRPETLVDVGRIAGLARISAGRSGLTIGALATMSRVAEHPDVLREAPAVAESLLSAASAQLRNMATIGGNLLQRTRCPYFRDPAGYAECNKRAPGSGCAALGHPTRDHAVLGTSPHCIALYPGDLAVALAALDATVRTTEREVAVADFFRLPGDTPEVETVLERGELVTAVQVPASAAARRSTYLKVRDRASYEFAAASAAVALDLAPDGAVADIRVALGGVATVPWRAHAVEAALVGRPLDEASVRAACRAAVDGATAHGDAAYKIALAPKVAARAILSLGGL